MAKKRSTGKRKRSRKAPRKVRTGLVTQTKYRDKKGRFTKKKKGAKVERYEYRVDELGKILIGRRVSREKKVTKFLREVDLDRDNGLIKEAFGRINVYTEAPYAKEIDVFIKGYTESGREVNLKQSLDLSEVRKKGEINDLLVYKIVNLLSENGYRTNYNLDLIKWSGKMTKRRDAASREPLRDLTISVRIRK